MLKSKSKMEKGKKVATGSVIDAIETAMDRGDKMSRIVTTVNWTLTPKRKERVSKKASEARPNESYTIKDLFNRGYAALDMRTVKRGEFGGEDEDVSHDDLDMGALSRMDMVDRDEAVHEIVERGKQAKEQLEEMRKKSPEKSGEVKKPKADKDDGVAKEDEKAKGKIPLAGEGED